MWSHVTAAVILHRSGYLSLGDQRWAILWVGLSALERTLAVEREEAPASKGVPGKVWSKVWSAWDLPARTRPAAGSRATARGRERPAATRRRAACGSGRVRQPHPPPYGG